MFRIFTDLDGYEVAVKLDSIIAVMDDGEFRIILTPFNDFEVQETLNEILKIEPKRDQIIYSKN
jgi:hypothetical protein